MKVKIMVTEMKYLYKVIKSESPSMPVGERLVSHTKLHDARLKSKEVELSDVDCNDYVLKLIKTMTKAIWEKYKANILEKRKEEKKTYTKRKSNFEAHVDKRIKEMKERKKDFADRRRKEKRKK